MPRRGSLTWPRTRSRSATEADSPKAAEVTEAAEAAEVNEVNEVNEATVRKRGYRRIIDYPRAGRRGPRALVPSRRLVLGTGFGAFAVVAGFLVISRSAEYQRRCSMPSSRKPHLLHQLRDLPARHRPRVGAGRGGKPLQGGSTITQQFVKNAYLTDQQKVGRKFTERASRPCLRS